MILVLSDAVQKDLSLAHSGGDDILRTLCEGSLRVLLARSPRDTVVEHISQGGGPL